MEISKNWIYRLTWSNEQQLFLTSLFDLISTLVQTSKIISPNQYFVNKISDSKKRFLKPNPIQHRPLFNHPITFIFFRPIIVINKLQLITCSEIFIWNNCQKYNQPTIQNVHDFTFLNLLLLAIIDFIIPFNLNLYFLPNRSYISLTNDQLRQLNFDSE